MFTCIEKCYCSLTAACLEHLPLRRAEMSSDAIAQKPLVFYDEYDAVVNVLREYGAQPADAVTSPALVAAE